MMNKCPKCGLEYQNGQTECLKCGIIFKKYEAFNSKKSSTRPPSTIARKTCHKKTSKTMSSRPHCDASDTIVYVGNESIKKTGCLKNVGAAFLILFILGAIGSLMNNDPKKSTTPSSSKQTVSQTKSRPETKVFKEGDKAHIGYTSYVVWRTWWSDRLHDNKLLNQKPDANFLFVELTVRNDDKKARSITPFKLIDENNAEYETSSKAWRVDNGLGILTSLNPGVQKKGVIVFDIPKGHAYKLKLSGGYWSSEKALVQLFPKASQ